MATVSVKIKGLDKFQKALGKYPAIAGKNIQEALSESVFYVAGQAAQVTPIDTGKLRRGVLKGVRIETLRGIISPNVQYAIHVHEGTPKMRGRPFLKQGLDKSTKKIETFFKESLEKTFKEIARKSKI